MPLLVMDTVSTVHIGDLWATFLVASALPVLVAFLAKQIASPALKGTLLFVLSIISGILTSIPAADGTLDIESAFAAAVVSFIFAVVMHFGILAPARLTGADGVVATRFPGGIG